MKSSLLYSSLYGENMKTFNELKEELNERKNEELNKTGIFYAFSNAQFEENKTHKNAQDNEFINVGFGAFIHKSNKQKLDNYINNIKPQLEKEFTNKINIDDLIKYELINHECYYTGEWDEIIPIIASYYPTLKENEIIEKIQKVYKSHLEQY